MRPLHTSISTLPVAAKSRFASMTTTLPLATGHEDIISFSICLCMQKGSTNTKLGPICGLSLSPFPTRRRDNRFRGQQVLARLRLGGLNVNSVQQEYCAPVLATNWKVTCSLSNHHLGPAP